MPVSDYKLAKLKARCKAFKTDGNEVKTLKIAAVFFFYLFFCVNFGDLKAFSKSDHYFENISKENQEQIRTTSRQF